MKITILGICIYLILWELYLMAVYCNKGNFLSFSLKKPENIQALSKGYKNDSWNM